MTFNEKNKNTALVAILFIVTSLFAFYSPLASLLVMIHYISIASFCYLFIASQWLAVDREKTDFFKNFGFDITPPSLLLISSKKDEMSKKYNHLLTTSNLMFSFSTCSFILSAILAIKSYPESPSFLFISVLAFSLYFCLFNSLRNSFDSRMDSLLSLSEADDASFDRVYPALFSMQQSSDRAVGLLTYIDSIISTGRNLTKLEMDNVINSAIEHGFLQGK